MALEKTFRELSHRLVRLRDRLKELRLSVVEDRPPKRDAAVVDRFEYAVEDALGWLDETIEAAGNAGQAVAPPADLETARARLGVCQERFQRISKCFASSLTSYDRIRELTGFGKERGGEWPSWVTSVRLGIEHCEMPLEEAGTALAECWQEIAERVPVRMEPVGQNESYEDGRGAVHGRVAEAEGNEWRAPARAAGFAGHAAQVTETGGN